MTDHVWTDCELAAALEELRSRREQRIAARIRPSTNTGMVAFRRRVLDALDTIDPARFIYIDRDRCVHVCPACRSDLPDYLAINWRGELAVADFRCSRGCATALIAAAIARGPA